MKRLVIIVGAIIISIAFIAGIIELGRKAKLWGKPDELIAIRAESIVDSKLLGLGLERRDEHGSYTLFEKRSPSVTLTFKSDDPPATKDKIVKFAEDDGWIYTDTAKTYDAWRAQKYVKDIKLILSIEAEKSSVEVWVSSSAD